MILALWINALIKIGKGLQNSHFSFETESPTHVIWQMWTSELFVCRLNNYLEWVEDIGNIEYQIAWLRLFIKLVF